MVPKCCGGSTLPDNILRVTEDEHVMCHELLRHIYTEKRQHRDLNFAYLFLKCNKHGDELTDEEVKILRREKSESMKGENNPNYGKPLSEERKQHLREIRLGTHLSPETREKISKANIGKCKGREPWNKGLTGVYSEETLRRKSESQKGKPRPYATGITHSEETRRKRSESVKAWHAAHPCTEERRRRISEGRKAQLARKKQRSA